MKRFGETALIIIRRTAGTRRSAGRYLSEGSLRVAIFAYGTF